MRLFMAVNFSDEVKNRILEIQARLRDQSTRGNFTRRENLHLTLAFLGETPEEKIKDLLGIIDGVKNPPFDVFFNRTGCFTHSRKELWWIGADPSGPGLLTLKDIHGRLNAGLKNAGFPIDERPFSAHITLGREIKHSSPIALDSPDITINAGRISLMKSEHLRGILTYTEL
jgi:2'-5' RNA ligase